MIIVASVCMLSGGSLRDFGGASRPNRAFPDLVDHFQKLIKLRIDNGDLGAMWP